MINYLLTLLNIIEYITGIITMVRNVDTISPDIKDTAIGANKLLFDNANGSSPITVVAADSIMALNLLSTASLHDSSTLWPWSLASFINSISRIPFLTTRPIKAIIPRKAVRDSG